MRAETAQSVQKVSTTVCGAKRRFRVFCARMADVFEDRRELDHERHPLWLLIDETRELDWLLLRKRGTRGGCSARALARTAALERLARRHRRGSGARRGADHSSFFRAPPAIRWVSYEPALERLDFERLRVAFPRAPARDGLKCAHRGRTLAWQKIRRDAGVGVAVGGVLGGAIGGYAAGPKGAIVGAKKGAAIGGRAPRVFRARGRLYLDRQHGAVSPAQVEARLHEVEIAVLWPVLHVGVPVAQLQP
jgi:hypothetical protein